MGKKVRRADSVGADFAGGRRVVSFNTPLYNRSGTCGSLLPGVSYRDGMLKSDSFAGREVKPDKALTFDDDGYVLTN